CGFAALYFLSRCRRVNIRTTGGAAGYWARRRQTRPYALCRRFSCSGAIFFFTTLFPLAPFVRVFIPSSFEGCKILHTFCILQAAGKTPTKMRVCSHSVPRRMQGCPLSGVLHPSGVFLHPSDTHTAAKLHVQNPRKVPFGLSLTAPISSLAL